MEPIILTVPMFSSPVVQLLIAGIAIIAGVRAAVRLLDLLPFV